MKKMSKGHFSSTVAASNMRRGAGPVAGAGELGYASGPGKAAKRVKPEMSGLPFEGGKQDYKPKGLKTTEQGD